MHTPATVSASRSGASSAVVTFNVETHFSFNPVQAAPPYDQKNLAFADGKKNKCGTYLWAPGPWSAWALN